MVVIRFQRMLIVVLVSTFFASSAWAKTSICYGTTSNGRLENAVQLPSKGKNFVGYSIAAKLAGRTYVHSAVRDIIVAAYNELEQEQPNKVYKYAETGFKKGGQFKPHKTHRNGLSVDFMTPVVDQKGISVHLPTNLLNRLGYDIEFDQQDRFQDMVIDYEALAAHLVILDKKAKAKGYKLWRVIFDPKLQPKLLATKYGRYLKDNTTFNNKTSWVRHDEHYHVDFEIPCKPM